MNQQYEQIKRLLTGNTRPVYIFDFDGTLSDGTHRLDKLPTKDLHLTESWSEFNRLAIHDSPFSDTIAVMRALWLSGAFVIILTGRSDEVKSESFAWLHENNATHFDFLVMRRHDDNRKDTVIKEEFLRFIGLDRITAAWDDSPNVINHFRSLGITTYAVCDYGDKAHAHLQSHGVDELKQCDHVWSQGLEELVATCVSCGKIDDEPCGHHVRHNNKCCKCGVKTGF